MKCTDDSRKAMFMLYLCLHNRALKNEYGQYMSVCENILQLNNFSGLLSEIASVDENLDSFCANGTTI